MLSLQDNCLAKSWQVLITTTFSATFPSTALFSDFHKNQLKVLLLQMKYTKAWALPGGFVKNEETLEAAAISVLNERTGLSNIFLQQFHVFSDPNRSELNPAIKELERSGSGDDLGWFSQRFISVGFYALVDYEKVTPTPDFFSDHCAWKAPEEIGQLMMDHRRRAAGIKPNNFG